MTTRGLQTVDCTNVKFPEYNSTTVVKVLQFLNKIHTEV